jgi:hypothetical protein
VNDQRTEKKEIGKGYERRVEQDKGTKGIKGSKTKGEGIPDEFQRYLRLEYNC